MAAQQHGRMPLRFVEAGQGPYIAARSAPMPTDSPAKPPTPAEQIERFESVVAGIEAAHVPKKPAKLGAEKLTPAQPFTRSHPRTL